MMNKKKTSLAGFHTKTSSLTLFALLCMSVCAWGAKQSDNSVKSTAATAQAVTGEEKPKYAAEQMPQFPGGEGSLMKFISNNLRYPKSAAEKKKDGRVTVRFVISKTGEVKNAEVIRGVEPTLDAEALRVVKMMPKWIPGKEKGENVAVYFTLPIFFKLEGKTTMNDAGMSTMKQPKMLILVDGVERPYSYLQDTTNISPKNIESLVVLKDSASTATYGEKGKWGVVVIKTKKK